MKNKAETGNSEVQLKVLQFGQLNPIKSHEKVLYSCRCDEEEKQTSEAFTKKTFCN